jgi:hypothetical protein
VTRPLLVLPLLLALGSLPHARSQETADLPEAAEPASGDPGSGASEPPPSSELPGAEERDERWGEGGYRTPLAGEAFETEVFGRQVTVEARDRGNTMAVSLGGVAFTPNIGGNTALPLFAYYWNYTKEETRWLRLVSSVFVNELDFAERFGGPELRFHFENYTLPIESSEIVDGQTLDQTTSMWGTVDSRIGIGYRRRIPPGNLDNDLEVAAYYVAGFEYHDLGDDAPPGAVGARDTYVHGMRVEVKLDAFQRNLLEMPHYGLAFGASFDIRRRDFWRTHGALNGIPDVSAPIVFERRDTRDFWKFDAYLVVALPVPFVSERHRFISYLYAGYAPHDTLDRFSAFRLGGGPAPSETEDLSRRIMPGAVFDQFPVEDYFVAIMEYRLELLFFLYLHVRGAYALLKAPTLTRQGRLRNIRQDTWIFSAALTSGFVWDSQLYFEYDFDVRGTFRGGREGHAFLLLWSKSF